MSDPKLTAARAAVAKEARRLKVDEWALTIAGGPMVADVMRIAQPISMDLDTAVARAIYDRAEAMVAESERRAKGAT